MCRVTIEIARGHQFEDSPLGFRRWALADTFQEIVDSLPDDWTDLELDLRIADESRYVEAAVYLTTCNAQPYSHNDWHWRLLVAHRFGHAASAPTCTATLELLDDAGIEGELVVRELRSGRAEVTQGWGRPQSAREEFRGCARSEPMARVLALTADLLFGSRVQGSYGGGRRGRADRRRAQVARAAWERMERRLAQVDSPTRGRVTRSRRLAEAVLVVDLTDDEPRRAAILEALAGDGALSGARTLGFYSHVEAEVRERAQQRRVRPRRAALADGARGRRARRRPRRLRLSRHGRRSAAG